MKALVVFYSLEGNTEKSAKIIKDELGSNAEILRLEPVKDVNKKGIMKFVHGGRQAMKEMEIELKPYTVDMKNVDIVFIGTPIWAGKSAPAINTFLKANDLNGKKVAFFFCSGSGNPGKTVSTLKTKLSGAQIIGEINLKMPAVRAIEEQEGQLKKWVKEILEK